MNRHVQQYQKGIVVMIMHKATLIFPHQLFESNPALQKDVPVFLVEEFLFFKQYNFHKQKLVLHRSSMKWYEDQLKQKGYDVTYIEATDIRSDVRELISHLFSQEITELLYVDPVDNWLHKRIKETCARFSIATNGFSSPNFLNKMEDVHSFFKNRKPYFQTDFYIWQRKQRNLLLDDNKKPLGGKWTFDAENRLKLPKNESVPKIQFPNENKWVKEAREYVEMHFVDNYGSIEHFKYPVTNKDAEAWLEEFLQQRFAKFGVYEDAMHTNESFLFHSVLTPMLNIGLLSPDDIIQKAIAFAAINEIPLNSLEGFVRQITGWREFIRIVYEAEGSKQRTNNYWKFKRKIPASFWNGTTGIEPIDIIIKRILTTGYAHHIERLMALGNFMLLCEFDPDEVYRWFMELFIDSYDWVMVPNVYGMTQFADGGLMTTKPYISSSNYLLKMGNWEKGNWQQTWDGLFWRFMSEHRNFFESNPRLGMLLTTWDKMDEAKRKNHLQFANDYLQQLDKSVI